MKQKNEFSTKILTLLAQNNLTQKDLADKIGISQAAISKILSGKYKTKISTLEKISSVLNVPASYFLDNNNKKNFEIKSNTINNSFNNSTETNYLKKQLELSKKEIELKNKEIELLKKEMKLKNKR